MQPGSDEWVAACRQRAVPADAPEVMVEYRTDDGAVWHLGWRHGTVVAAAGAAADPDVVLTFDATCAAAMRDGSLQLQEAVAEGRLRISGDAAALARARLTLLALAG